LRITHAFARARRTPQLTVRMRRAWDSAPQRVSVDASGARLWGTDAPLRASEEVMTRLLPCAALVLFAACAARSAPPAHPARSEPAEPPAASAPAATDEVIELEPLRIEVVRDEITGETTFEATDARSLFDAGNEALVTGKHEEALGRYDRLLADFPDSSLVAPALYNAGLA